MSPAKLAYAAGALDADGCFSIKRIDPTARKATMSQQTMIYQPQVALGQVLPAACRFLKDLFGGGIRIERRRKDNHRDIYRYKVQAKQAAELCKKVVPYLLLKKKQAQTLIDLHECQHDSEFRSPLHWWLQEHPRWQHEPMLTSHEVTDILGYSPDAVYKALYLGQLVSLPVRSNVARPRFPASLILYLKSIRGAGGRYTLPPQYIQYCNKLWDKVRLLNTLGRRGTCVTHRTGYFTQKRGPQV